MGNWVMSCLVLSLLFLPVGFLLYSLLFLHPRCARRWKEVVDLISHPDEFIAALVVLKKRRVPCHKTKTIEEEYCFEVLKKVSRSFASVIGELHEELRVAVCVFYLVLRGLDTIEDDVEIPIDVKKQELTAFAKNINIKGWNSKKGYGASNVDEMLLLENFEKVIVVYQALKKEYRETIEDITIRMAEGMIYYLEHSVDTKEDYNKYCYYAAGLVGIGLTELFKHSGLMPKQDFDNINNLSVSMGLFLQKTNIIRDYLEDAEQNPPRHFYPREIWSKYSKSLDDFRYIENREQAVACLNDMVTDALQHIPDCLTYMATITEPQSFKFCAIPQVMAIATLERVYNNGEVFEGAVKIRKGEAAKLILNVDTFDAAVDTFRYYLVKILRRIPKDSPLAPKTAQAVQTGLDAAAQWSPLTKNSKKNM